MPTMLDEDSTAAVLAGTWQLGAANLTEWVDEGRSDPVFSFEVIGSEPLMVQEEQRFTTTDGKERVVTRTGVWSGKMMRSRSRSLLRNTVSNWCVSGVGRDGAFLILRTVTAGVAQDGLLVLTRLDAPPSGLRSAIASSAEQFGLAAEDFASLSWLDLAATA